MFRDAFRISDPLQRVVRQEVNEWLKVRGKENQNPGFREQRNLASCNRLRGGIGNGKGRKAPDVTRSATPDKDGPDSVDPYRESRYETPPCRRRLPC